MTNAAGGVDSSTRTYAFAGTNNTIQTNGRLTLSGKLTGNGGFTFDYPTSNLGQLLISGATNDYMGETVVNRGTLLAVNTAGSATGSGVVTVNANGTLGGNGLISGSVSAAGTIRPGVASTGSGAQGNLRLGGGLSLNNGGTYNWSLGVLSPSSPGTNYDVITLTGGNLALGGTSKLTLDFLTLELAGTGPNSGNAFWNQPHSWTILDLMGTATNSGNTNFTSITNPNFASGSFSLLNPTVTGGEVVLVFTPVPEPISLLAIGAAGLCAIRIRKRRRRSTTSTSSA